MDEICGIENLIERVENLEDCLMHGKKTEIFFRFFCLFRGKGKEKTTLNMSVKKLKKMFFESAQNTVYSELIKPKSPFLKASST